jgi:hypothetical protein
LPVRFIPAKGSCIGKCGLLFPSPLRKAGIRRLWISALAEDDKWIDCVQSGPCKFPAFAGRGDTERETPHLVARGLDPDVKSPDFSPIAA